MRGIGLQTPPGFPFDDQHMGIRMSVGFGALTPGRTEVVEARYGCRPDKEASMATARAVGLVPYGRSLVLAAPLHGPVS